MTDPLSDTDPFEDLAYAEVRAELNRQVELAKGKELSNYEKVREFHKATNSTLDQWPSTEDYIDFRIYLIQEEFDELFEEFYPDRFNPIYDVNADLSKVAKELADLLYVVYGTAASLGIPIDKVFDEVHKSNMSKLVDGKPLLRDDGKVLKGPNYQPPDLSFLGKDND